MFKYSLDNKRYHTLNYYYRQIFSHKVFKVSLNGNFSCPNFKNGNGCIFCLHGSNDYDTSKNNDLVKQFYEVANVLEKKWPGSFYIGYFQANTNTYAPLAILKEKYETILKLPNVVGLSIATRSDAITSDVYDYLETLNKKTFLTIELGLQSAKDETLKLINRGHTVENFVNCVKELKKRNIKVVVHIINGLPYETKEDMINTVKFLNNLGIDGIKIHMLSILKGTNLAKMYEEEKFPILTKEEYVDIVCRQLRYLNPEVVIHRITADPNVDDLIAPTWLIKKFGVLNEIDKEMKKRDIYQGDLVTNKN
jgi:radical SAM protein (TIGR01212 family)